MNGKWVIFIVVLVTLIGVALAWYLLQIIPSQASSEESEIIINTSHWFSNYLTTINK